MCLFSEDETRGYGAMEVNDTLASATCYNWGREFFLVFKVEENIIYFAKWILIYLRRFNHMIAQNRMRIDRIVLQGETQHAHFVNI